MKNIIPAAIMAAATSVQQHDKPMGIAPKNYIRAENKKIAKRRAANKAAKKMRQKQRRQK